MTTIADFCDEALLTAGATYVGDLVEAAPFLADGPLENAALLPGAIVLVGRGGCPFAPRCNYATERCVADMPPSRDLGAAHEAACWLNEDSAGASDLPDAPLPGVSA